MHGTESIGVLPSSTAVQCSAVQFKLVSFLPSLSAGRGERERGRVAVPAAPGWPFRCGWAVCLLYRRRSGVGWPTREEDGETPLWRASEWGLHRGGEAAAAGAGRGSTSTRGKQFGSRGLSRQPTTTKSARCSAPRGPRGGRQARGTRGFPRRIRFRAAMASRRRGEGRRGARRARGGVWAVIQGESLC